MTVSLRLSARRFAAFLPASNIWRIARSRRDAARPSSKKFEQFGDHAGKQRKNRLRIMLELRCLATTLRVGRGSSIPKDALGGCGLRMPRHKLKMAFARPLSLNLRLTKSRDRERSIITHKNCERDTNSKNHHGAATIASVAQLRGAVCIRLFVGVLAAAARARH